MKKTTIKKLLMYRIKSLDSFLKNQNISMVAFVSIGNEIPPPKGGAAPLIKTGQREMEDMQDFLQTVSVRRCGFTPNGAGMDVPGYDLYFYDENAMPVVKMYITHTGYLSCGDWVYRITASSAEDVWEQLGSLYESAVSLQN